MRTIKNLSNTGWTIIDNPGVMGTGVNVFEINFSSNDTEYTSMRFEDRGDSGILFYDDTEIVRYPAGEWEDERYQTIEIDGGVDVANPMLISWLGKYAKNGTPSAQTADIVEALQGIATAIEEGGGGGGGDVEGTSVKSTGVESGRVLTADGEGGASWEDAGGNVESVNGQTGEVVLTKSDVGLGNVDNTSDADKPISTATQSALNNKQAKLVSGTNIKTINNESILGGGNLTIHEELGGDTFRPLMWLKDSQYEGTLQVSGTSGHGIFELRLVVDDEDAYNYINNITSGLSEQNYSWCAFPKFESNTEYPEEVDLPSLFNSFSSAPFVRLGMDMLMSESGGNTTAYCYEVSSANYSLTDLYTEFLPIIIAVPSVDECQPVPEIPPLLIRINVLDIKKAFKFIPNS